MDPVSMAAVGMGASALGGVTGAIGSMFTGQAQSNMYTYQAGVAQINAQIAEQNANYATYAGEVQAQQSGMATRQEVGTTKAIQGASGLDVNTGSAARVRSSEEEVGQENQALVRSNAVRQAYGYRVQAMQDTAQAQIDTYAASTAKTSGQIGAFTSLLGGASSVSSSWLKASQAGVFGSGFGIGG